MYQQLVAPNLSVVGEAGECLAYVRAVFGASGHYATAAIGWENAAYKHEGDPPTNIACPVWFSWETDGHVAVWVHGEIYSTSKEGDKVFPSIEALLTFMGDGMTYLGWSEDVDGRRVVEPVPAPTPVPSGQTINLPVSSGPWHLYKPSGPYNPNNPADYIAIVHPALYAPSGITYPIVANLGNGIYRITSPAHGIADLWTKGSNVIIK